MSCNPYNFLLIIAEKSKAAKKIAEALSPKPRLCRAYSVNFWVFTYQSKNIVVAPAAGHLFNLYGNSSFPVFKADWRPLWEIDKSARYTKKYYDLLKFLSSRAIEYINACDYDIEGSVIGYMIIKFFGDLKKAKRMKFSALTKEDIQKAFHSLQPLDYNMINAGIARHKVDWLWGINVSRALMRALKDVTNKRVILSAGRVQSPTLIYVVNNYIARQQFVPLPYYVTYVTFTIKGRKFKVKLDKQFDSKQKALEFAKLLKGEKIKVKEVREEDNIVPRPPPFNLGDLQAEAGRLLGFSPYITERIAEQLYLDGLISYPRTNSQKIPPTVDIRNIVNGLNGVFPKLITLLNNLTKGKYVVRQGEKEDPAHPAIYPTGEKPDRLSKREFSLYELITRRFLASISEDAKVRSQRIIFSLSKESFQINLQHIIFKGWLLLYPYKEIRDEELLNVKEGDEFEVEQVSVLMKLSSPPISNLTKIDILKWMESSGLGTEATRGRIIETLFDRKYLILKNKRYVEPTNLGIIISKILNDYFSDLTSVKMTSVMESKLNSIISGKTTVEEVVNETISVLRKYLDKYNEVKDLVGRKLGNVLGLLKYEKCKICDLEAYQDGLCKYHYDANKKLDEALKIWRERSGLKEEEVIKKLLISKSTGKFIKDVLKYKSKMM
jgi:DNA topoisomerase-1